MVERHQIGIFGQLCCRWMLARRRSVRSEGGRGPSLGSGIAGGNAAGNPSSFRPAAPRDEAPVLRSAWSASLGFRSCAAVPAGHQGRFPLDMGSIARIRSWCGQGLERPWAQAARRRCQAAGPLRDLLTFCSRAGQRFRGGFETGFADVSSSVFVLDAKGTNSVHSRQRRLTPGWNPAATLRRRPDRGSDQGSLASGKCLH